VNAGVEVGVVVSVVGLTGEEEEVGGEDGEDRRLRVRLEGEVRERGREGPGMVVVVVVVLAVFGSLADGSGAGCGAMRAKEEGWIRRRADGFCTKELAKQQLPSLIPAWV
jgi:hypothetical protein